MAGAAGTGVVERLCKVLVLGIRDVWRPGANGEGLICYLQMHQALPKRSRGGWLRSEHANTLRKAPCPAMVQFPEPLLAHSL